MTRFALCLELVSGILIFSFPLYLQLSHGGTRRSIGRVVAEMQSSEQLRTVVTAARLHFARVHNISSAPCADATTCWHCAKYELPMMGTQNKSHLAVHCTGTKPEWGEKYERADRYEGLRLSRHIFSNVSMLA